MEPLKNVQVEGHLMYAEPDEIFGNLDELCYVSFVIYTMLSTSCATHNTTQPIYMLE